MADRSKVEWTDASWNPVTGCSPVSPGCRNCYAARLASTRLQHLPQYEGLAKDGKWTGRSRFNREQLRKPKEWKKPRRIFVCSMGDLFHEGTLPGEIFAVLVAMASAPHHTYQVLTKRPKRARRILTNAPANSIWPLPNVWLGVTAENQEQADKRIPILLDTPAAVRWVSVEPMLGAVYLQGIDAEMAEHEGMYFVDALTGEHTDMGRPCADLPRLDWVVAGGETGPGARPMHPEWVRSLRDQCQEAGVPFMLKQWGDWGQLEGSGAGEPTPVGFWTEYHGYERESILYESGSHYFIRGMTSAREPHMVRIGKKHTGRELDGQVWDEMPGGE